MKSTFLILPILLAGCASRPAPPAEPPPAQCKTGEFRGVGVGTNEKEALGEAKADLAKQIHSSVQVSEKYSQSQNVRNGKENLGSDFVSETLVEASLLNAHDARTISVEQRGDKVSTIVCMSRADAAKGFIERQQLVADTLELVSRALQAAEHPKQKNEAWLRIQALWHEFIRIQNLLDGWEINKSKLFDSANAAYSARRNEYVTYCQNAKLHWNPERETLYSEIVFSKLSGSIKMEKSNCTSMGISLVYKNSEPECMVKFGLNSCSYTQSLSLRSCDGIEYLQLKNDITGAHQKQDFALEKLQSNLKSAEFWNQWIQEIQQWRPLCE